MSNGTVVEFVREGGQTITLGNGEYDLSVHLLKGSMGLGIGPTSFESTPILSGNGSILLGKRIDERDIFVPILVEADDPADLEEKREWLRHVLSPLDTRPLFVRVWVAGRSAYREIQVHYKGGLDGDFTENVGDDWQVFGIEFRAFDALWSGSPETIDRQVAPGTKPFLGGTSFFPMELSGSSIAGRLDLMVAGNAPTSPVFVITPPGNSVALTHVDSGKTFSITGTLTEVTTINMETGRVTSASWPNNELYDRVTVGSNLFDLNPGINAVDIAMPGATTASKIVMTYQPKYLGGH